MDADGLPLIYSVERFLADESDVMGLWGLVRGGVPNQKMEKQKTSGIKIEGV